MGVTIDYHVVSDLSNTLVIKKVCILISILGTALRENLLHVVAPVPLHGQFQRCSWDNSYPMPWGVETLMPPWSAHLCDFPFGLWCLFWNHWSFEFNAVWLPFVPDSFLCTWVFLPAYTPVSSFMVPTCPYLISAFAAHGFVCSVFLYFPCLCSHHQCLDYLCLLPFIRLSAFKPVFVKQHSVSISTTSACLCMSALGPFSLCPCLQ